MLANSYTEAADAFESAREISPFDSRLDALMARAHLAGGDIDEAAAAVLRGLRKSHEHPDCLTILEQLKKPNPCTMASALLRLEADSEVSAERETFVFVPSWSEE
jgi:predicted Zn-dependent protease